MTNKNHITTELVADAKFTNAKGEGALKIVSVADGFVAYIFDDGRVSACGVDHFTTLIATGDLVAIK